MKLNRFKKAGALAVAVVLAFARPALAASGDLDPSFSQDGKVITDFGGSDAVAKAVAIQGDGKIVVAGLSQVGSGFDSRDFALLRYNPNGTLDKTFSGDGKARTDFFGFRDEANAVAIDVSGRITVVGFAQENSGIDSAAFALARFNPDGTPDTSFSGDGKLTTDFADQDQARAVVIQPDGKIVVAGFSSGTSCEFVAGYSRGTSCVFALARYNPDGTLDAAFSGDGKVTTGVRGGGGANGVAVQGDGKIVAAGFSQKVSLLNGLHPRRFTLVRYMTDGTLDPTFSGDGIVTTEFSSASVALDAAANAVAVKSDGKIVAAGESGTCCLVFFDHFALAQYKADGTLDTSLSGDGMVTTGFGGGNGGATAVTVQGDGKIVAAGQATTRPFAATDFAVARYNHDGALDSTFSGDGKVTTDFKLFGSDDGANGVAIQADGKIVAAGFASHASVTRIALGRYQG